MNISQTRNGGDNLDYDVQEIGSDETVSNDPDGLTYQNQEIRDDGYDAEPLGVYSTPAWVIALTTSALVLLLVVGMAAGAIYYLVVTPISTP